jgi:hypothetical protein
MVQSPAGQLGVHPMKRVLLVVALALVVSPAQAETLLAEFGWNSPLPVTTPARHEFIVRQSLTTSPSASLVTDLTAFGTTPVDAATVAQFNNMLAGSDDTQRVVYVSNGGQTPPRNDIAFNAIWSSLEPPPGFHYEAHVPRLGSALFGYQITRMEHSITAQGQTVFFYGAVIPEPASCLLAFMGGIMLSAKKFRRCRKQ